MSTRSIGLFLLYVVGVVALSAWSLSHAFAGTVTGENATLVIALPIAWILGFWALVGPLVVAQRIWQLQAILDEHCRRRAQGLDADTTPEDLEEALFTLATEEHAIPEDWARRIVRLMLQRTPPG